MLGVQIYACDTKDCAGENRVGVRGACCRSSAKLSDNKRGRIMKKTIVLSLVISACLFAAKKEITKTGWNFGLLPVIAYNTDLGFEYGVLFNFVNFGDGSSYPNYNQKVYVEASRYTKGSGIYRVYYDSYTLIPGLRFIGDVSYLPDRAYTFYGYNGYESVYNADWEDPDAPSYRTRVFYRYDRDFLRLKADFQGKIRGNTLRWAAGITGRNCKVASVDIDKMNKGQDEEDKLTPQPGLYEKYVDWGLISDAEKDGGFITTVKAGLIYDSRDVISDPGRGIWSEATLIASPRALGSEVDFIKLNLTHRQYITLWPQTLVFAYRLGYQETLSGKTPFYYLPIIEPSEMLASKSEGLGGAQFNRGIMRTRMIGEGMLYGNFEFRLKFWRFTVANQNIYLGTNLFLDAGRVVTPVDVDVSQVTATEDQIAYFHPGAEKMHYSTGLGFKIAMNQNFIVSVDYGVALDEQDGDSGLYILLNYLF
ncbi:hypothetical protein EH222_06840 [candidate division KSB1 bacterium]|nr:MAG: hypothetical protein EH222_06840 [candidate division KSB1 bacterium]